MSPHPPRPHGLNLLKLWLVNIILLKFVRRKMLCHWREFKRKKDKKNETSTAVGCVFSSWSAFLLIVLAWHLFPSALAFFYCAANKHTNVLLGGTSFRIHHGSSVTSQSPDSRLFLFEEKNHGRKNKFPVQTVPPRLHNSDYSLRDFCNDVSKYIRFISISLNAVLPKLPDNHDRAHRPM